MRYLVTLLLGIAATAPMPGTGAQPVTESTAPDSPQFCPVDRRDGPLYEEGLPLYGIPAERIVASFLSPPHDSWGRVATGTQSVDVSTLRILANGQDDEACRRLTLVLSSGRWDSPPTGSWVYFTAGDFYFLSQWKPAQLLSNYTTSYGHVIVLDADFRILEAIAF